MEHRWKSWHGMTTNGDTSIEPWILRLKSLSPPTLRLGSRQTTNEGSVLWGKENPWKWSSIWQLVLLKEPVLRQDFPHKGVLLSCPLIVILEIQFCHRVKKLGERKIENFQWVLDKVRVTILKDFPTLGEDAGLYKSSSKTLSGSKTFFGKLKKRGTSLKKFFLFLKKLISSYNIYIYMLIYSFLISWTNLVIRFPKIPRNFFS